MPRKKKILYAITKSNWGGAQAYVYDLATNLPRDQYDVTVACGGSGILTDRLTQAGIRVIPITSLAKEIELQSDLQAFQSMLAVLHTEKPDILHLNSPKIGGIGALAGRIRKVPRIIYTPHGWAFNEIDRSFLWKLFARVASWATMLFAHAIITVSHLDTVQATSFPLVKSTKIFRIPIGIRPLSIMSKEAAQAALLEKANIVLNKEVLWIGTIGELTANKGHRYLIDALSQVKIDEHDFRAFMIGDGQLKESLVQYTRDKGMHKRIHFISIPTDASAYLSAFDLYVQPSQKEGYPYTLLEAISAGVTIIASEVGGIPEIITHNQTGFLVPPRNVELLRDAIETLSHHENKREQLGAAARDRARATLSFDQVFEKTIALYQ